MPPWAAKITRIGLRIHKVVKTVITVQILDRVMIEPNVLHSVPGVKVHIGDGTRPEVAELGADDCSTAARLVVIILSTR